MINDSWSLYASELKASLWGDFSPEDTEMFYDKYSPVTRDVVDGWNALEWQLLITGGWKSSTRNCYAVMQTTKR